MVNLIWQIMVKGTGFSILLNNNHLCPDLDGQFVPPIMFKGTGWIVLIY